MATLYLTPAEQKVFDALSAVLREGWSVQEEALTAAESDDVLRLRAGMANFDRWPHLHSLVDAVSKGQEITAEQASAIPEEALPELLFTIGARGMTHLLAVLLKEVQTDEDIRALAALSQLRHDVLETNGSITYV